MQNIQYKDIWDIPNHCTKVTDLYHQNWYLQILYNELNNIEVDLVTESPISMLCDSDSAVIIAYIDKYIKSVKHCKRQLFYIHQQEKR